MNSISVSKPLAAPRQAVWDVLADFGNIASWNSGVGTSYLTDGADEVSEGSQRHCDLKPAGGLDETLVVMDEPGRAVVSIDKVTGIPIKHGEVEFLLEEGADETTPTTINYSFEPKGGPFGGIVGRMLERQLRKGFGGFLDDLEVAAQNAS